MLIDLDDKDSYITLVSRSRLTFVKESNIGPLFGIHNNDIIINFFYELSRSNRDYYFSEEKSLIYRFSSYRNSIYLRKINK